jgi:hypothetical protein
MSPNDLFAAAERKSRPRGHVAVMSQRVEADDSLDYFPTPPWATRALFIHVLQRHGVAGLGLRQHEIGRMTAWEPACGEGHMAEAMLEWCRDVHASDVHDYGYGDVFDFTGDANDPYGPVDWIITNPPFNAAEAFFERAFRRAGMGVAMIVRLAWLATEGRHDRLFNRHPPTCVAQFAERCAMVKGRWDPEASTATDYCWVVWVKAEVLAKRLTKLIWIPPGCRRSLTRANDYERFAARRAAPLLDAQS